MKTKIRFHRVLALLLCFCMLASLTPAAYAAPADWTYAGDDSVTWVGNDSEGYTSATFYYVNKNTHETQGVTVTPTVNTTQPTCARAARGPIRSVSQTGKTRIILRSTVRGAA